MQKGLPLVEFSGQGLVWLGPEVARLAYAQSHLLTLFLIDEHGPDRIGRFLRALAEGKTQAEAAEDAFHRSLDQIFTAWESGV